MNPLENALEDLKTKINEHVRSLQNDPNWHQLLRLYGALGVLEDLSERTRTSLSALLGIEQLERAPSEINYDSQTPGQASRKRTRRRA